MASFTLSPSTVTVSTTGNVITLTGVGTSWSGSPFSITSLTGATITAQNVISTTSATITISAGTLTESISVSDGTNTNLFTVTPSGWAQASSDDFVRANQSPWGNNWSDSSSFSSIVSNLGHLTGGNTPWENPVIRPLTETQSQTNQRVSVVFPSTFGTTTAQYIALRDVGTSTASYSYLAGYTGGNTLGIFKCIAGAVSGIGTAATITPVSGHSYHLDMSVTGTSPTTITVTMTDLTTLTSVTNTQTDSSAGLQVAQGSAGVYVYTTSGQTSNLSSFVSLIPAVAATAVTMTGPTAGSIGNPSSNFTIDTNGYISSNVVVTPSDSGGGGTFTPTSVTLTPNDTSTPAAQTFTYTAGSSGTKTISVTNGSSLTNPSTISYSTTVTGVNSTAFRFSPGNWTGDTGRGGTVWRSTWNPGAYFDFVFTASSSPALTINIPTTATGCYVSYFLNGVLTDNVAATGNITVTGITASASNTLRVILRNSPQATRWNYGVNTLKVTGITLDSGSSVATAPTYSKWVLVVGDSITEGTSTAPGPNPDVLYDYSYYLGQALLRAGYDYCNDACGFSGYMVTGDASGTSGDVPYYYRTVSGVYQSGSRWNKVDNGVSFLDSNSQLSSYGSTGTPPSAIYINLGTNEALQSISTSDLTYSITACITALRAAAPAAAILIQLPFGLYYSGYSSTYPTAIQTGVANYLSANPSDSKVSLLDFGKTISNTVQAGVYINTDNIHITSYGHAFVSPLVTESVLSAVGVGSGSGGSGGHSGFLGM